MAFFLRRCNLPVTAALKQLRPAAMAAPTIAPRWQLSQGRCFGLMDTLQNTASSKVNDNREKQFMKMIELMVNQPKWTLRLWKGTMDEQLNSWLMYIPGMVSE
jgi:hypothetical protein